MAVTVFVLIGIEEVIGLEDWRLGVESETEIDCRSAVDLNSSWAGLAIVSAVLKSAVVVGLDLTEVVFELVDESSKLIIGSGTLMKTK